MGIRNKQLSRVPLPEDLQKVTEKLVLIYGADLTICDCISISPETFGSQRYVGKKYVQQFNRLIFYLNREHINEEDTAAERIPHLDKPVRTVPEKYRALFEKLKECYNPSSLATYADIININPLSSHSY